MNYNVNINDDKYEAYQQSIGAMNIKFTINTNRKHALFDTVDFALTAELTTAMRLKLFCILLRNSVCELMKKNIKTIYHITIKDEYEQFKNKTTWHVVQSTCLVDHSNEIISLIVGTGNTNVIDFENILLLYCDIKDFVDNMAKAFDIEI